MKQLFIALLLCAASALASVRSDMPETTEADLVKDTMSLPEPEYPAPRAPAPVPLTLDDDEPQAFYRTPYSPGHSECRYVSPTLMDCPTNALNARQPGESQGAFLDRELADGLRGVEDYPGCREQAGNVFICPKPSMGSR